MKTATNEEWKRIGNQAKKVRDELFILSNMCSEKMPLAITKYINLSIRALDRFRSDAENRMFKTSSSQSVKVFYGKGD